MCLDKFFNPQAVAIIGATENPQSITSTIINNLFEMDFKGSIYEKFILGGNIHVNKDITVDSEVVNSTVKTLGAIIILKGRTINIRIYHRAYSLDIMFQLLTKNFAKKPCSSDRRERFAD